MPKTNTMNNDMMLVDKTKLTKIIKVVKTLINHQLGKNLVNEKMFDTGYNPVTKKYMCCLETEPGYILKEFEEYYFECFEDNPIYPDYLYVSKTSSKDYHILIFQILKDKCEITIESLVIDIANDINKKYTEYINSLLEEI